MQLCHRHGTIQKLKNLQNTECKILFEMLPVEIEFAKSYFTIT